MSDTTLNYTRKDPSSTRVELTITVPGKEYDSAYEKELGKIGEDVKMKGFRPGKAPKDMLEASQGTEARKKALESIISKYASEAIKKEEIFPAFSPSVDVTDVSENMDVTFVAKIPVVPEIKIPDLSKLGIEREKVDVEDKEVDEIIKRLWQEHRGKFKDKSDKWVQSVSPKIGFNAKTLEELKKEIGEAVKKEKTRLTEESFARASLLKAIELAEVEVPDELVDYEAAEREQSFMGTLEQMKMTEDEFCEKQGVKMDDMKKQWKKDAKEAVETDVFLASYARDRNVKVSTEELDNEVEIMRQRSQDPDSDVFDNPEWRRYIERVMLKRMAFSAFLDEVRKSVKVSTSTSKSAGKKSVKRAQKKDKKSNSS